MLSARCTTAAADPKRKRSMYRLTLCSMATADHLLGPQLQICGRKTPLHYTSYFLPNRQGATMEEIT